MPKSTDADLDPVSIAAGKFEPKLAAAIEHAIELVKDRIDSKALSAALEAGDTAGAIKLLNIEQALAEAFAGVGIEADVSSVSETLVAAFQAGANAGLAKVPKQLAAELTFDLLNPDAVAFLKTYEFGLIKDISEGTAAAIGAVIQEAYQGLPPAKAAKKIVSLIGLTKKQQRAVANFQNALIAGDPASLRRILSAELRDKRFDRTIQAVIDEGGVLSAEQIQRMTDRYYERFLRYRAHMIARTETIRAAVKGQQLLWEQAVASGKLDPAKVQRRWVTAGDERVCPICAPLDGEKAGLYEDFPEGDPPAHPMCRCGLVLDFD